MIILIIVWVIRADLSYMNGVMESAVRLPSVSAVFMKRIKDEVYVLSRLNNGIVLDQVSLDLRNTIRVFTLIGRNIYTPASFFYNDTRVFILLTVNLTDVNEIPMLKFNPSLQVLSTQGLILEIALNNFSLVSSQLITQCYQGSTWALDGFYYMSAVILLTKDTCSGRFILNRLGGTSFILNVTGDSGNIGVDADSLYIVSRSRYLYLYKYNFSLVQVWSLKVFNSGYVDVQFNSNIFLFLSKYIYNISLNGTIEEVLYYNNYTFQAVFYNSGNLYLLGQGGNNNSMILWMDLNGNIVSQRSYYNVSEFIGLAWGSGCYYLLILSYTSFYSEFYDLGQLSSLVFSAKEPFEMSLCDRSCYRCFGAGSGACYNCRYYEMSLSNHNSCGVCDPGCSVCYGPSLSECNECSQGYILSGSACYKDLNCGAGYYQSLVLQACIKCDASCLNCTSSSSNDCIFCTEGYLLDQTSCTSACPSGKYPAQGKCELCNPSCINCTGNSTCTSCKYNLYFYQGSCLLSCPSHTFINNSACLDCQQFCRNCTSTGCYKCDPGYYLDNFACLPCGKHCERCDKNQCHMCVQNYHLVGSQCLYNCSSGFYGDGSGCYQCDSSCLECRGGMGNQCTACNRSLLVSGHCLHIDSCPSSYYLRGQECLECSQNCMHCNNLTCTACDYGFQYQNGSCLNCSANNCTCDAGCIVCKEGVCLKCNNTLYLSQGNCVESCQPTDYILNNTCYCSQDCKSCYKDSCIECRDGMSLINGTCANCENCKACTNNTCYLCMPGFVLLNNTCVLQCDPGYYFLNQTCDKCGDRCDVCNQTGCIKCGANYTLYGYYTLHNYDCLDTISCFYGFEPGSSGCVPSSSYMIESISILTFINKLLSV
jgi:hypothetical protein